VSCDYPVTVGASGGQTGEYATWTGADLEFVLSATQQRSSSFLSRTDLVNWFGSDRIASGGGYTATRAAFWSGAFTLIHTFRYTMPNGETRSSLFYLFCN
jgi:hypothetical protein